LGWLLAPAKEKPPGPSGSGGFSLLVEMLGTLILFLMTFVILYAVAQNYLGE